MNILFLVLLLTSNLPQAEAILEGFFNWLSSTWNSFTTWVANVWNRIWGKPPVTSSGGSSNSTSTGSQSSTTGKASFYNDAGLGACGSSINAKSDTLVAVPKNLWTAPNANDDPLCKKCVDVTTADSKKLDKVPIKDKCPGCDAKKIDLSEAAFAKLADTGKGIIDVTWTVVDC